MRAARDSGLGAGVRDEHCHIIWGVDDGAESQDMSWLMLDQAIAAGIDHIVCTPHMRWDDFDKAKVEQRFAAFAERAADAFVPQKRVGINVDFPPDAAGMPASVSLFSRVDFPALV